MELAAPDVPLADVMEAAAVDNIEGWDSITHVGAILTVEDELGIQFEVERITAFENAGERIDECAASLANK